MNCGVMEKPINPEEYFFPRIRGVELVSYSHYGLAGVKMQLCRSIW